MKLYIYAFIVKPFIEYLGGCNNIVIPNHFFATVNFSMRKKTERLEWLRVNIDNKYKLIFADPPYNSFEPKELIENINNQNILDTNGLLIIEHKNQLKIETKYNQMKCISKRKYGDSAISIFKQENNG